MPDRESLRQALVQIIEAELGEQPRNVEDTVSLREGLGIDSVDLAGVVMGVESHFRIRLSHQDLENVGRVGDLLDLLQAKLVAPPQSLAA